MPFPVPLTAVDPLGGLIYNSSATAEIAASGESDRFTIDLDDGQTITVVVDPDAQLQPTIELLDPDGTPIGSAAAAAVGEDAVLQTVPTTAAGTYTVTVGSASHSTGPYTVQLILNAAVEWESHHGPANNHPASAQDLDAALLPLGNGPAERGAVLGSWPLCSATMVDAEDFESGALSEQWSLWPAWLRGRIRITGEYGTAGGSYALLMDQDYYDPDSLNEAVWTVDLAGIEEPALTFFHAEWRDEVDPFSGDFSGSFHADGVAISDDGLNWHPVWEAPDQIDGVWEPHAIDLSAEATAAGMTLGPDFKIKFQQCGTSPLPSDGRGYDEIMITPLEDDWYAFTLDDGQSATLAVKTTPVATPWVSPVALLELYDSGQNLLAKGVTAADLDQVIDRFVDLTSDGVSQSYYVRIRGTDQYSLLVTRDSGFDVESKIGSPQHVQEITSTPTVFGYMGLMPDEMAVEQQKLTASDASRIDYFGYCVSISSDTAIVGARRDRDAGYESGSAYVFRFDGGQWLEQQKLTASDTSGDDHFGYSVSISNETAIVGAEGHDAAGTDSGSAYVFRFHGGQWIQEQKLTASDAADQDLFGCSVSINNETAIIGACGDDDAAGDSGSAYVFRFDGSQWVEEQKLTASDVAREQWFGKSVYIGGDTAIVGAEGDGHAGSGSGAAYVFRFDGTQWIREQKLTASDASTGDYFGCCVAIDGQTAVVGAYGDFAGSAYVFRFDGHQWVQQQKLTASDASRGDYFGFSVSLDGQTAIVGAYFDDLTGSAYVFRFDGGQWLERQKLVAFYPVPYAWFGCSVAVSGDAIMVGAYGDESTYVFLPEQDAYAVGVDAGDSFVISTTTPADGPGEFVNAFDPLVMLYDPGGTLVASDDNGGPDGRNVLLEHTAEVAGTYKVRVRRARQSTGEYVLDVDGHTGPPSTRFEVAAIRPADGDRMISLRKRITVDFNDPIRVPSLQAADLTVDGIGVAGVWLIDADTAAFEPPELGEGVHPVAIAGGAILDLQGTPIEPFAAQFVIDRSGPRVVGSSILEGGSVPPGTLVYTAEFDEQLQQSSYDSWSVPLLGDYCPRRFDSRSALFDRETLTLTVEYADLWEDNYTLKLRSGLNGFEDVLGHDLDGEPHPTDTVPSGDGVPGGDFDVHFSVDVLTTDARPFERIEPLGSLTSVSRRNVGLLNFTGDEDDYGFFAEAGETISAVVDPRDPAATLSIELPGLAGPFSAAGPGEPVVLPLTRIPADGSYAVRVAGDTSGYFELEIRRNAVVEMVDTGEGSELALDDSFLPLGSGRYGALGTGGGPRVEAWVWGVQPASGEIIRIDPTTGTVVGSLAAPDGLSAEHTEIGLAMAEGGRSLLYVNSDVDPRRLYRLDPITGAVLSVENTDGAIYDGLGFEDRGGQQVLYSANMETDPGWTLEGGWEYGVPTGGGSADGDPTSGYTGTHVIGYNLDGDYPNNIPAEYATMPAFDASGCRDVTLSFRRWLGIYCGAGDHATIEISLDGVHWGAVWEPPRRDWRSDDSWVLANHDISAIADDQPHVLLRWAMGPTDDSVTYPGWNLDDVLVLGTPLSAPTTFLGRDGVAVRRRVGYSGIESTHFAAAAPSGAIGGDGADRQFAFVPELGIVEFDSWVRDTVLGTLPAPAADVEGLAFDGGRLYASTASGRLYTLHPDSGEILNVITVPDGPLFGLGAMAAPPEPGRLFSVNHSPDGMVELDPATGAELYRFRPPAHVWGGMAGLTFDGTTLFFLIENPFYGHMLYEINPDTGQVIHSEELDLLGDDRWSWSDEGLAALNGNIYILEEDGNRSYIYEFDPVSRTVTRTLDVKSINSLFIVDALAAITEPDMLLAFASERPFPDRGWIGEIDPVTGIMRNKFPLPFRTDGLAVVDGEIYCAHWGEPEISVYSRSGRLLRTIQFPHAFSVGLAGEGSQRRLLAQRTELLQNGGFETGDFSGWTATSNELTPWTVGPAGGGFFYNSLPLIGRYSAYNGFDGAAGLVYEMYQDVAIPEGFDRITLTTNHRIVCTGGDTGGEDRVFEISVRDTDNQLLEILYSETIPPDVTPERDRGWNTQGFHLSAYAGGTVRIHFRELIPEDYAGPAMIEFDEISLAAEQLVAWVLPDVDEYTLDLTGKAGRPIDVILAGQGGTDFSDEILELLDPDGQTVLATASPDPLGLPATNYDLAIFNFVVPADGLYALRLSSTIDGQYGIVVSDAAVIDAEPNDEPTDALRSLDGVGTALGYLGDLAGSDWYTISLAAGDATVLWTETPLDGPAGSPPNDLDPELLVLDPGGQTVAADTNSATDGKNAYLGFVAPDNGTYFVRVAAETGQGEYLLKVRPAAEVSGRYVFYNNSAFDGDDPGADSRDNNAVATDKIALRPGGTARFENYTSYSRGVNGIMVDIAGPAGTPTVDDFGFRVGNDNDPAGWSPVAAAPDVTVRGGAGTGGADRVTIIWTDNLIQNQWLQLTVKATPNTGLAGPDVFYFGNAIGESGNSTTDAKVNAYDMLGARDNQRTFIHPAPIDFNYDYDRDARVNAYDMLIARDNQTHFLNALKLIRVPGGRATGEDAAALTQARAHDSVLRQAVADRSWLYEFEPARVPPRPDGKTRSVAEGVDQLLIADWPA